jgi:MoaA/NifB/PqqE/SkfB family radical SAM enzyme
MELAKEINVGIVRWLEPRPCGGFSAGDSNILLDDNDRKALKELYVKLNSSAEYVDYPMISYEAFYEDPENLGCMMAGNSQLYIDTLGNVQPCVFLPVSFGNIMKDDLSVIFAKMRSTVTKPVKSVCPSVLLGQAIKSRREHSGDVIVHLEEIEKEFKAILR